MYYIIDVHKWTNFHLIFMTLYYFFIPFVTRKINLEFRICWTANFIESTRNHKRFNHRCWEIVPMSRRKYLFIHVELPFSYERFTSSTDSNVIKFQRKFRTFSLQVQIASWSIPWPEIFRFHACSHS